MALATISSITSRRYLRILCRRGPQQRVRLVSALFQPFLRSNILEGAPGGGMEDRQNCWPPWFDAPAHPSTSYILFSARTC